MRKLKLFFACLLMAVLSIGQVWADPAAVGTTLFSENFGGYSNTNVPSGSVSTVSGKRVVYGDGSVTYTSADGTGTKAGTTKVTTENNGNLAGGTSPELMVGKKGTSTGATGGSFSIAGIPSGDAKAITVVYKQNAQNLSVSVAGTGYSTTFTGGKPSAAGERTFDITVDDGADATFTLTFQAAATSNVRVDDILVTVKTAGEGGGPAKTLTSIAVSGTPTKTSYESGENFDPAGLTVTGTYSDASSGPITSGITWAYNPSQTLAANQTSIGVTATVGEITSTEFTVNGLSVAAGPDVTLDLIDGNWGFPTSNTTGTETYTNSATGYSVTCYAPTNYKVSGSSYFYLGKSGAYIELPSFSSPIEKIVVTGNSGASTSVIWNIFKGDDAVSTAATGCAESSYTFNIDPEEANVTYTLKVTSAHNLQIKAIKIYFGAAPAVAKPTISGDENFVTSTTVTLSHADADAIYYTTDGSDPKTSGTKQTYSVPFTVNADGTTTVKAYAVKGSDESAVAEKTFTKVTPMTTAAALRTFATSSNQNAFIQLDGWKVTHVKGNNAYLLDPSNEGVVLNNASHGYAAGDELNDELVEATIKLNYGRVQLTGFTSSDITATAGTVSPAEISGFSTLTSVHQSRLVTLKNALYSSSDGTLSDGASEIYYYDQFSANPTLVDGATYNVTGIVIYYDNGSTTQKVQIAPRTSADVVATTPVVIPTAANLAALKAAARGTYILTLENAVVTYVNGKNAFIEDATGGALIYFQNHGFTAGDCLNGEYQVTTEDYQGKFEITAMEPQTGAAKTTAEIPLTTVSIATLNASFGSYESRRVKIVGADVTDGIGDSDRNGAINDGAALAVYAGVTNTITLTVNDNVDIIGYPGFHNTDQQLTVWAQADITVNEKEDPELAYNPTVVNVLLSDLASFTPAVLEYATGFDGVAAITYESSDPSIATVGETTGVVEVVATAEGSATITASFPGNPTYKVDNASYTINVSATPIAPVYTMSFDMTRASYDAAADAQVVWNSSVVTMTANKNDGTKVTNYLAGNYSGTTLIAETRFYTKNSISFVPQAGVTVTKVEWLATEKGYATKLAAETFDNATAVVDGTNDKLVVITPMAVGEFSVTLTDAARAKSIVVYYQAESEKAPLTASIAIANINTAVGAEDILLSDIAATSNPNKNAISYAITSGTAVSLVGEGKAAAFHAVEEGTATITATIPNDLGNYTGATTTFEITVSAAATLESIAISGNASVLEYNDGDEFNPAGLVVTGHYSDDSEAEITDGITWAFDPTTLSEGDESVSVTATVGGITSAEFVVNDLTVSGPAPVGDNYVKVTASQADWSGDYILVYEDGENAYVWNGDYSDGASNYASATISSNTIAKPAAAAVITIAAASEGKYTLQVNGDKYFQDNGSNAKLIFTDAIADAAEVTISYETDWTKLLFSERCIRFNNTSGQTRFRFYAANNQQAVQLYKKETPEPPTPTEYVTVRTSLVEGRHYTVCLEKNVTAVKGATFWSLTYKNAAGTEAYLVQENVPFAAGTPYIIQATGDNEGKLEVVYGTETATDPVEIGVLRGTFSDLSATQLNALTDAGQTIYMLFNNELRPIGTDNHLDAHRAYVRYDLLTEAPTSNFAPGKTVKGMPMQKDQAQGFENLDASEKPLKVMIDGTLYILRGEKVYDATGRLVK